MKQEKQEKNVKKQWITPEVEIISVESGTISGSEGVTFATAHGSPKGDGLS